MVINGTDALLFMSADGATYKPAGYSTSCAVSISNAILDSSNKLTGVDRQIRYGVNSWEMTLDTYYSLDAGIYGIKELIDNLYSGTEMYTKFSTAKAGTTSGGGADLTGKAYITNLSITAGNNEMMTVAITLTGNGELSKNAVPALPTLSTPLASLTNGNVINGQLFALMDSTNKIVANSTTMSIEISRESIDTASKTTGKWAGSLPSRVSWTISSDCQIDSDVVQTGYTSVYDFIAENNEMSFKAGTLTPASSISNTGVIEDGALVLSGNLIINNLEVSAGDAELVTFNFSADGSGELGREIYTAP